MNSVLMLGMLPYLWGKIPRFPLQCILLGAALLSLLVAEHRSIERSTIDLGRRLVRLVGTPLLACSPVKPRVSKWNRPANVAHAVRAQ